MDDAPDTARLHLRQIAEGQPSNERTFARALETLLEKQEEHRMREAVREGQARVWRWLGGAAASVAITLGGWALALASQASADHYRLDELELDVRAAAASDASESERLDEIAIRTTRIEVIVQRIDERRSP